MTIEERLAKHLGRTPDIAQAAYVAASAVVEGDVVLGPESSVWHQVVLRGDINEIRLGAGSNIQDGTVVHLADDFGCYIGDRTVVGHKAMVHACTVGDECLVGMCATILDGAVIGNRCIVAAGALVTKGTQVPDGSLVMGAPAKVVRPLRPDEIESIPALAAKYVKVARAHAAKRQP